MDDFQENPFEFLKAAHLSQMGISEEKEEEKRKSMMGRVKIKFECCRDEQQQQSHMKQQQQLKNHQKMEMKVFQRKLKRTDVTVVQGGNMNMNMKKKKMNSSRNDFSTCPVCSKFFHNKKALFGHMRAHPERQWRGIQPPVPTPLMEVKKTKKKNYSSSSTVSDSLVRNVDEQIDSASTSGRLGFDVLLGSVSNWPGTVKRRRNVAISDHRVLDAIDGLMMLVNGNSMETDHGLYMDLLSKNEEMEVIEEQVSERSKKRRIEELEAMNKSEDVEAMNKWKKLKVYHRNGGDLRTGFVPELMKMECGAQMGVVDDEYNKQIPASFAPELMKMECGAQMGVVDDEYNKQIPASITVINKPETSGFKCGICNKSFPSYQALGGHKSRHCRNTTFQPDYHHQYKNVSCPNLIKVDIDLKEFNDTRPKDVDYKHKCKVCGKTFPTGQALGGHQRSHWNITNGAASTSVSSMTLPQMHNVETPSGSVASLEDPGKTNIKLLEFNLNELPPVDYDEECLSQLVPPVFGLTA